MIVSLLEDFDDIFLEDIFSGLLSLREIKHQINFVLRVTIFNRIASQSNTKEENKKNKKKNFKDK